MPETTQQLERQVCKPQVYCGVCRCWQFVRANNRAFCGHTGTLSGDEFEALAKSVNQDVEAFRRLVWVGYE